MPTTISAQKPRRRAWHWVVGLGLAALVLGAAWKPFLRYQASTELRAAGFVYQGRPSLWKVARKDWRGLFSRETWKAVPWVSTSDDAAQLRDLDTVGPALRRLDIEVVLILNCPKLVNVDGLKNVPTLKSLRLFTCTALQNVDGLKGLPALKDVDLSNCSALENVDGLNGLPALYQVLLGGCTNLSPEAVAALTGSFSRNMLIVRPDLTSGPLNRRSESR